MSFRPEDPAHDATIRAFVSELPWELQDVTRVLIRALRSDREPYGAVMGSVQRYSMRSRRVGQSLERVVAAVDELVLVFLLPRVPDYERGETHRQVLAWAATGYGRAD